MATKNYLSLQRLQEYDALIKAKILADDASTLAAAKKYTEDEIKKVVDGEVTKATAAEKLSTPRNIALSGDATGSVAFDGSADVTIEVAVTDNSHNHTIENVSGLTEVLANKSESDHKHDDAYYSKTLGEGLKSTLDEVKEDVDAFFKDATISEAAKDTLKEIQDYITSDAQAAEQMLLSIASKADSEHYHEVVEINDFGTAVRSVKVKNADSADAATKATQDGNGKVIADTYAEKATTLDGYGITNAYTKGEADTAISNAITTYDGEWSEVTAAQINALFAEQA